MTDNQPTNDGQQQTSQQIWDAEAPAFDDQPDHGLRDPLILTAWTQLLKKHLHSVKGAVLDIGCGTGSLSVVLAGLGYTVTGIDFSPEMIARARAKAEASGHVIAFHMMDAASPQLDHQQFDAIVCRHLLWTLPEPDQVLGRWIKLLKPGGHLLLIEGYWFTSAGLHAAEIIDMLPSSLTDIAIHPLSDQAELWGRVVDDERYAITAHLKTNNGSGNTQ